MWTTPHFNPRKHPIFPSEENETLVNPQAKYTEYTMRVTKEKINKAVLSHFTTSSEESDSSEDEGLPQEASANQDVRGLRSRKQKAAEEYLEEYVNEKSHTE